MPKKTCPTQRETVILAILTNGEKFGRQIRDEYQTRTQTTMPVGSLYTTLERMEFDYGFIKSRDGDQSDEPNSHRRRYFTLTANGQRALDCARTFLRAAVLGSHQ